MGRNRRKMRATPDETFSLGPLAFARFGKLMVSQNHMTSEEHAAFAKRLKERYPTLVEEIKTKITELRKRVAEVDPIKLLQRVQNTMIASLLGIQRESEIGAQQALKMRMLSYLQSIVVSTAPSEQQEETITDEAFAEIETLYQEIDGKVYIEYPMCENAFCKQVDDNSEEDTARDIKYLTQQFYNGTSGKQYQKLVPENLRKLLSPHDDILLSSFGVNSVQIANSLQRIQGALTDGMIKAGMEIREIQKECIDQAISNVSTEELSEEDIKEAMINTNRPMNRPILANRGVR